jgi:hypothetical protein
MIAPHSFTSFCRFTPPSGSSRMEAAGELTPGGPILIGTLKWHLTEMPLSAAYYQHPPPFRQVPHADNAKRTAPANRTERANQQTNRTERANKQTNRTERANKQANRTERANRQTNRTERAERKPCVRDSTSRKPLERTQPQNEPNRAREPTNEPNRATTAEATS